MYFGQDTALLARAKQYLEGTGSFCVSTFSSATDAAEQLKTTGYDAIVSDSQMPGTDGIAFLRQLRASGLLTPFILVTGKYDEEKVTEALNNGADVYIWKNTDHDVSFFELAGRIRQVVLRDRLLTDLEKSERNYRQVVDNVNEAIFVIQDGHLKEVNPKTVELLGYPHEDVLSRPFTDFVSPEYRDITVSRFNARMDQKNVPARYTIRLKRKDGSYRWVEVSVVVISWDERPATLTFLTDVTDKKQAEDTLKANETRYHRFFEDLQDLFYETDTKGCFVYLSPSVFRFTGWTREELLGKTARRLYALPDDKARLLKEIAQTGYVRDYELLLKKKDGTLITVSLTGHRLCDGSGAFAGVTGILRDITKRKKEEDELRVSRKLYKAIVEDQTEFICLFSPDFTHIFANEAYCRYFGKTQKELINSRFRPQIHPDDMQNVRSFFSSLTREKPVGSIENRIIMPDGSIRWQQWSDRAIFDTNGRIVEYESVGRDITERKDAETALEASERRKTAIVAAMPDTLALISRDGIIKNLLIRNTGLCVLKSHDLIGTSIHNLGISAESTDRILAGIASAIDTGSLQTLGFDLIHESSRLHFEARIVRFDKDQTLCVIRDITNYTRMLVALQESEAKFKRIFERIEDLYFQTDTEGSIQIVSPSLFRISGWTEEDVVGKTGADFCTCTEDLKVIRSLFNKDGYVRDFNLSLIKKDGTTAETSISAFLIRDENGQPDGVSGLIRDISERRRGEEALRQANRKLNLLSSITRHDINNQLTALQGFLGILESIRPEPVTENYLLKCTEAAERIANMIRFTKDYEEIGITVPAWHDAQTLIRTAAADAPLGQVKVINDLPKGLEVYADPLISRVFYNLMDNAVRYGKNITTIRFFAYGQYDDQVIVCEDDGAGIAAGDKDKIFMRGFGKNTGLGLPLSREILSITGITLNETGTPGKGARFEITIPKDIFRFHRKVE